MRKVFLVVAILALSVSANANFLVNGGFEQGLNGWTPVTFFGGNWESHGAFPHGQPVEPYEGSGMAGALSSWDTSRNEAYIYQQFASPGGYLEISFWGYARAWMFGPAGMYDVGVRLGFDPEGGNDSFAESIIWADEVWSESQWQFRSITVENAPAGTNTVFIKSIHKWGIEWNISAADNVQVVPEPASMMVLGAGLVSLIGARLRKRS